ncbi:MAG TPA: phosphopantetheine-binding protein [Flavobacterium sp.]|nr:MULTISPECIES: phosphopantetheine-binding protein [unclassified Flavobacterium]HRE78549.1 phosphopantetheine-binding protein [Flavobacterium sp.]
MKQRTNNNMEALKQELKAKIIAALNLEHISVEEFDDNETLFGDGIGLDSIDALELIVLLDKDYGIKLTDPKEGKTIFQSVETMANYIAANRTK